MVRLTTFCPALRLAMVVMVMGTTAMAFRLKMNVAEATKFLKQYSYMGETHPDATFGQMTDDRAYRAALMAYQLNMNLTVTGVLDAETAAFMAKPRCGMPDFFNMRDVMRRKRYALAGSKWETDVLTYRFMNYSPDLPQNVIEDEFHRAFQTWSEVTNLDFVKITSGRADIEILFYPRAHGDGNPFDGQGGVLAHAYFPHTSPIGGDAHFDDDEYWTSRSHDGVNLFQVVVHELGHSLGLSHSNDYSAIMFPSYLGYQEDFKLGRDDIRGIQELYGVRSPGYPIPTPAPTPRPTENPPTQRPSTPDREQFCQTGTVDAIAAFGGAVYAFQGSSYAKLDEGGILPGYPRAISADWPDLPNDIDAILDVNNRGVLIFFKDDQYYRYDARDNQLRFISKQNVFYGFKDMPTHLDAAFVWEINGHQFVVKGDKYYRLMVGPPLFFVVTDEGLYPKDLAYWKLPVETVDAATSYETRTYFFKGRDYYRYNDITMKVEDGYPKSIARYWFGCEGDAWSHEMEMNAAKENNLIVGVPVSGAPAKLSISRTVLLQVLVVVLAVAM